MLQTRFALLALAVALPLTVPASAVAAGQIYGTAGGDIAFSDASDEKNSLTYGWNTAFPDRHRFTDTLTGANAAGNGLCTAPATTVDCNFGYPINSLLFSLAGDDDSLLMQGDTTWPAIALGAGGVDSLQT